MGSYYKNLGLYISFLNWLHSYLSNRQQKTKTFHGLSDTRKVTFGVPQGSVLGPLLFIFFVNSIPDCRRFANIAMYADDIVLYTSHKNPRLAFRNIQTDFGAELDSDLNLARFVTTTVFKMSNKVFKLAKLRSYVNEMTAITVYTQAILPLADYCCVLADSARRDLCHRLQVIQNQALRICLKTRVRDEMVQGLH